MNCKWSRRSWHISLFYLPRNTYSYLHGRDHIKKENTQHVLFYFLDQSPHWSTILDFQTWISCSPLFRHEAEGRGGGGGCSLPWEAKTLKKYFEFMRILAKFCYHLPHPHPLSVEPLASSLLLITPALQYWDYFSLSWFQLTFLSQSRFRS